MVPSPGNYPPTIEYYCRRSLISIPYDPTELNQSLTIVSNRHRVSALVIDRRRSSSNASDRHCSSAIGHRSSSMVGEHTETSLFS